MNEMILVRRNKKQEHFFYVYLSHHNIRRLVLRNLCLFMRCGTAHDPNRSKKEGGREGIPCTTDVVTMNRKRRMYRLWEFRQDGVNLVSSHIDRFIIGGVKDDDIDTSHSNASSKKYGTVWSPMNRTVR